jgi:uncharacterized protein YbjT (DUF2867 family)
MYAILGASGNTGSVVARSLLAAGKKVRLVVRDASKVASLTAAGAEVAIGAIDDPASLTRAFTGASGAYVLMPPDLGTADLRAENARRADAIRAAAVAAKLPHLVLLSSIGAQMAEGAGPISTLHYAEKTLSSIPGTVLTAIRAAYFLENLAGLLTPMKTQGVLPIFATHLDAAIPMVATRDIGETAARALLEPPKASEVVVLAGPKEVTYTAAAAAFAAALGRDVKAVSVPFDAVVPTFTGMGMSTHMAGLYREMVEGFDSGRITHDGVGRHVRGKIGVEEFAKTLVG